MGRPLQPRHPMTIFSATFWTLDFVLAFFVGYYVSGIPSRFENCGAAHAPAPLDPCAARHPGTAAAVHSQELRENLDGARPYPADAPWAGMASSHEHSSVGSELLVVCLFSEERSRFEWIDAAVPDLPSLPSLLRSSRSFRILRFLKRLGCWSYQE